MSIDEIKNFLVALSAEERSEVAAFLFHLCHISDPEHQAEIDAAIGDKDPEHWLTPEEFETRLDAP